MPYDIIWTPTARRSYVDILKYLNEHWSQTELIEFEAHVSEVLQLIAQFPMIYEYSEQSDTHRCVLFSQVSLFYQVKKQTTEVELLLFWDNRQDPENLQI
ncbi:type II toxin-antitoxin system RelE/ParE family toxin [Halalkalibaculum sp. DA3122]|uniref:type II toxin-antitoxin system RelE/ParE family toxin n=1 Tax=Halalkalibaculum sp. DA3122 TaxID=3373607 RepID=UPI003754AF78